MSGSEQEETEKGKISENSSDRDNHEGDKETPGEGTQEKEEQGHSNEERKGETGTLDKPADQAKSPQDTEKHQQNDPTSILTSLSKEERTFFLSVAGLSTFMRSTGRLFWTNFLMGLARGIGFVIGMSIIGAICVGVWQEILSVTGIGKFIARILEEISRNTTP